MGSQVFYNVSGNSYPVTPVTFTTTTDGSMADPTSVTCVVTDPQGNQTTYTYTLGNTGYNKIVRTSTGNYSLILLSLSLSGLYTFTWIGTGNNVQQITPGTFRVVPMSDPGSGMQRWYTGMEELKSRLEMLNTQPTFNIDNYEIQMAIQASKGFIDSYCMQHFDQITEARTFEPYNIWEVSIDPLCSDPALISNLEVAVDVNGYGVYDQVWVNGTDFQLKHEDGEYNAYTYGVRRPYKKLQVIRSAPGDATTGQWLPFVWPFTRYNRVQITGTWGWDEIPPAVREASMILCVDMFKMKEAPFGNMGIADLGVVKASANPMIVELLRPFINMKKKVGC